jgi:hypothetical protein
LLGLITISTALMRKSTRRHWWSGLPTAKVHSSKGFAKKVKRVTTTRGHGHRRTTHAARMPMVTRPKRGPIQRPASSREASPPPKRRMIRAKRTRIQ